MRRWSAPILVLCALVLGPLAGTAAAARLTAPVADCNAHGQLTQSYTAQQLRTALATMPADIKEYTNCYNVIDNALLHKLGKLTGPGGSGSGGGSFLPTWLIIVLALLVLGGAAFGFVAIRRPGEEDQPPGPGRSGPGAGGPGAGEGADEDGPGAGAPRPGPPPADD